jgi:hypothetical protein
MNKLISLIFFKKTLLALLFLIGAQDALASVSGAIFTTDVNRNFVNANVYNSREDVYLNGGPHPNARCTAAGLPDGDYYFQVTNPSGTILFSSDTVAERRVHVFRGIIVAYLGTTHLTGLGKCSGSITVQLFPYNPTTSPGGEYKVWMTPVRDYTPGSGYFGFLRNKSKTDNFKVICPTDFANTCAGPVPGFPISYRDDEKSGISGVVLMRPISPVSRLGDPDSRPLPNAILVVEPAGGGGQITRHNADADGRFQIGLTPGTYQIVALAPQPTRTMPGGGKPTTVTVLPGHWVEVMLYYDTGIR